MLSSRPGCCPAASRPRRWLAPACAPALALLLLGSSVAGADEVITPRPIPVPPVQEPLPHEPENPDGPVFRVSKFVLVYAQEHPDQPSLDGLLPLDVQLGRMESGYVNPREGVPTETVTLGGRTNEVQLFHASSIGSIGRQLLPALQAHDLAGVYVAPHEDDIDVENERDLRLPHDSLLRLVVHIGRIRELRTIGSGDRTQADRIDDRMHRRIRLRSPLQPKGTGLKNTTDLLRKDLLEDYLHRLNRHPGRKVEAALGPSSDGEGIALDYRVIEAKPWFAYFQSSNTGTEQTATWQQRIGFVHRQLTSRDDILSVEYMNAGIDRVHAVHASYEAPWFGKRRPAWMRKTQAAPGMLSWVPRQSLPWFGSDRLRWQLSGYWSGFKAEAVAITDDFEGSDWGGGGRLIYNAWQHGALFLDLAAGFKVRNVEVLNTSIASTGQEFFMLPELDVRLERFNEYSAFTADLSWEHNVGGTREDTLALLGRANPDGDWHLLRWDAGVAHYLEPLLAPKAWKDPNTPRSSTLAHEISIGTRGQYAFDYRLVPQVSQVVGGLYSVRGYPASIGTGDSVYLGSVEYRFHLPQALPIRREPVRLPVLGDFRTAPQQVYGRADWDLILRAFVDAGKTVRNGQSLALGPEPDQTLLGAGLGVELRLGRSLRARMDWGRALKSARSGSRRVEKGHNEFHFLFSVMY